MSLTRIKAILLQEFFVTVRAIEVIIDIFVFPTMSIIVFGFLSTFLAQSTNPIIGEYVIMGMLLWQLIFIVQYSVSVGSLWNIWSKNLSNLFIAPLQVKEYILAQTLSGIVKACIILSVGSVVSFYVFHFNILQLGLLALFVFTSNLFIFAFSAGLAILGLIFRFGTRIQAFAWGLLPMLQPITAAFYPVSVLPEPLRSIAYIFPPTYIFEAARADLLYHTIQWNMILVATLINIIYCFLAIIFFMIMFKKSKDTGQFARNEG